jgi:hypothetical protein
MVQGVQDALALLTLANAAQVDSKQHSSYLFENNTEFAIRFFRVDRSGLPPLAEGQILDLPGNFDCMHTFTLIVPFTYIHIMRLTHD